MLGKVCFDTFRALSSTHRDGKLIENPTLVRCFVQYLFIPGAGLGKRHCQHHLQRGKVTQLVFLADRCVNLEIQFMERMVFSLLLLIRIHSLTLVLVSTYRIDASDTAFKSKGVPQPWRKIVLVWNFLITRKVVIIFFCEECKEHSIFCCIRVVKSKPGLTGIQKVTYCRSVWG